MDAFARNTRVKDNVLQRYMAVHVMEPKTAYAHVDGDYELLNLTARKPPLHAYNEIDPVNFVRGAKTMDTEAGGQEFARFCDRVVPRPVDEEAWLTATRRDRWIDAALFLVAGMKEKGARAPHVKQLVEACLVHKDADAQGNVYRAIQAYQFGDRIQAAREMGALIATVKELDPVETEAEHLDNNAENDLEVPSYVSVDQDIVLIAAPSNVDEQALAQRLESFRRANHLAPTVSTTRLAKQVVFAAARLDPKSVLLRGQEAIVPVDDQALVQDCIKYVCTHCDWNPNESEPCVKAAREARRHEWTSADLVAAAIACSVAGAHDVELARAIHLE